MRAVVCLLALAGSAASARADTPDQQVLALLNRHRALAGLRPVKLDGALSKGCMEHAEYMRLNHGTAAMQGLNPHTQDPALPGASPGGAACGKAADLFAGVADLGAAVEGWLASLYHRRPMLTPTLDRIGVGYAKLPDGSLVAALMFVDAKTTTSAWPVAYPVADQRDVPLEFTRGEIPNPIPGGGLGGYPITLQFPPFDAVTGVTATLVDAAGKPVAFHLSTPERPATSFGQYGVVCVIPKLPLAPSSRYTVTIKATWKGAPRSQSWSFSTVALRRLDATDEAGLAGALGRPSLVRGTVLHGGMMNSTTVFLQIGKRDGARFKMVSVLIPVAVWNALTRSAQPDAWKARTVEVESTPELAQGTYLNLPVALASQLRAVK
jgi:hypothetical protein